MTKLTINEEEYTVDVEPDVPLLWVIREHLKLTGTKFGCGMGLCGACTVHINGKAQRSCQIPVQQAQGKKITTIEGLSEEHPVKKAWIREDVPQCGYCQPGQIMQAASMLAEKPNPTHEEIMEYMNGNICRCSTYPRIKTAINTAIKEGKKK